MRTLLSLLCAALAALLAGSCSRSWSEPAPEPTGSLLSFRTKAPAPAEIKTLEAIVFRVGDPSRYYASQRLLGAGGGSLRLPRGAYRLYLLANLPAFTGSAEEELLSLRADYALNEADALQMPGMAEVDLTGDTQIQVPLQRICARIIVEGDITFDDNSPGGNLRSAFLLNIPSEWQPFLDGPSAGMYNHRQVPILPDGTLSAADVPALSFVNHSGGSLGDFTLHAFPNDAEEATDRAVEDDVTKLVIAVERGGSLHYYPLGLPGVQRNHVYRISRIRIGAHPGSDMPNAYPKLLTPVRFTLRVAEETFVDFQQTI